MEENGPDTCGGCLVRRIIRPSGGGRNSAPPRSVSAPAPQAQSPPTRAARSGRGGGEDRLAVVVAGLVGGGAERVEVDLVGVAPAPLLLRLERLDDRVLAGVKLAGGVLVLGVVTAADVAALGAEAQMDP